MHTDSRWNRKIVSLGSPDTPAPRRPSSSRNSRPSRLMGPNVSTAIGTNSWGAGKVAYLLRFRSAACSAAPSGTDDDRWRKEAAHVWMAVKSQAMYFPLTHGTSVAPSGLLPSVLMRPDGSFVQGVSAFVRALHTKSLTAKCLAAADLPADCLQTSPWWPLGSAVS